MNKIIEVITEPARVETGSKFVLKIKAIRYLTYKELSSIKVGDLFKDSEPTLNIY